MRVLSLDRCDVSAERTGVFTSGNVWVFQQRWIALFFTGAKHAGENLGRRAAPAAARVAASHPDVRCAFAEHAQAPAITANGGGELPRPWKAGIREGHRQFPAQCRFVLETLGEVYKYDEQARTARLTPGGAAPLSPAAQQAGNG
jgi:hypothetical protein